MKLNVTLIYLVIEILAGHANHQFENEQIKQALPSIISAVAGEQPLKDF